MQVSSCLRDTWGLSEGLFIPVSRHIERHGVSVAIEVTEVALVTPASMVRTWAIQWWTFVGTGALEAWQRCSHFWGQ